MLYNSLFLCKFADKIFTPYEKKTCCITFTDVPSVCSCTDRVLIHTCIGLEIYWVTNKNVVSGCSCSFATIVEKEFVLKSATKPFNVLLACTRPLITELSYKLRLKCPLLPTTPLTPQCYLRQYAVSCL